VTYANAGHPPPLLLTRHRDGTSTLSQTAPGAPALGVFPEISAPETTVDFPRGSQLCIFTDGLYETLGENKAHGSYDEFVAYLAAQVATGKPLYESMVHWLDRARDRKSIDDDVSLLRFMTRH
jgi:sigma-B regulation protein RsbU (phosphoserine phosphatase)